MGILLNEILCQHGDVFFAMTQGRQMNGNHIKAIVEIFAEGSFFNLLLENLICCRDNPHIDLDVLRAADPSKCFFLYNSKKLYLK